MTGTMRVPAGHDRPSTTSSSGWTVDTRPLRTRDPSMVDGFRLVSRLGSGGMADVFYAVASSGEPVVLKLLRPARDAFEAARREFRLAYAVDAECTSQPLGYGMSAAGAYLFSAYLPGYRVGTTLMGRSTSTGRLWALGHALARVLASVHARGVVHCDVKPSNLLVRGLDVRVIDFGIARFTGEVADDERIVRCSRGWAAPEQLQSVPAAPTMDIFAWGCVVAYLAGGVHPFGSRSEQEWILRVQSAEPDLCGLPEGLDQVVGWTLARNALDRPSAAELATICRMGLAGHRRPSRRSTARSAPATVAIPAARPGRAGLRQNPTRSSVGGRQELVSRPQNGLAIEHSG